MELKSQCKWVRYLMVRNISWMWQGSEAEGGAKESMQVDVVSDGVEYKLDMAGE